MKGNTGLLAIVANVDAHFALLVHYGLDRHGDLPLEFGCINRLALLLAEHEFG
jgi:hypothetical protein